MYLDGKRLRMEPNESEQEHIMAIEQGEMMLLWQLHNDPTPARPSRSPLVCACSDTCHDYRGP